MDTTERQGRNVRKIMNEYFNTITNLERIKFTSMYMYTRICKSNGHEIVGVVYVCGGGSVVQGGERETRNEETNEGYSAIFQSHSQVNVQITSVRSKLATVTLNHMWYGDDRK